MTESSNKFMLFSWWQGHNPPTWPCSHCCLGVRFYKNFVLNFAVMERKFRILCRVCIPLTEYYYFSVGKLALQDFLKKKKKKVTFLAMLFEKLLKIYCCFIWKKLI